MKNRLIRLGLVPGLEVDDGGVDIFFMAVVCVVPLRLATAGSWQACAGTKLGRQAPPTMLCRELLPPATGSPSLRRRLRLCQGDKLGKSG